MKKAINIMLIIFGVCTLPQLILCSGSDIAGGAGTGNPGKTTFIIVASDTTTANQLPKSLKVEEIVIPDSLRNYYNIDSFSVIIWRIHFVFSPEDEQRINAIEVLPPLHKDPSSIVLEGPFTFNALTGIPDSVFGTVLLPEANYTAVRLDIDNKPNKNSIFIGGTFSYRGELRAFKFDLSLKTSFEYKHDKGVYVSGRDSTEMKVVLDASRWFADVNIVDCINSQTSPFDSNGVFVLNGKINNGICAEIPKKINDNIVNSGKLKVKQVKLK